MSDMSFKQAKELVEKMEFSEIAIKKAVKNLETSSKNFEKTLQAQEEIVSRIPASDKKLSIMFILIALNAGFLIGLLFGKFVL